MNPHNDALIIDRKKELSALKNEIALMTPEKALDTILNYPQPPALVHAFKEEDLHFLIHDIGLADSLPLLGLASEKQWDYIVDVETWQKDRVDFVSTIHWLELLLKADPERLARWCYNERLEFMELFLSRNIEVRIREKNQDGSEFGDDYFTDDETLYIRFLDYPVAHASEKKFKEKRDEVLSQLLKQLSLYDHALYQGFLLEAASVIPAEAEEELFRLRNVRLAEKGFLPFDQAIGVYQPLKPGEIEAKGRKVYPQTDENLGLSPVPVYTTSMLEGDNLFIHSLRQVTDDAVVRQLQTEFAGLCNQLVSADKKIIKSRQQLSRVTQKAAAYLSIGIEILMHQNKDANEKEGRYRLERILLSDIFKTGYGPVLKLKWRVDKWRARSWFQDAGLPLSFWGETGLGIIGGLLVEKPLFYDPLSGDRPYREFMCLEEIQTAESVFERIAALDDLFFRMDLTLGPVRTLKHLSYKNLILTLWARHYMNLPHPETGEMAIPIDRFRRFFAELWENNNGRQSIGDTLKAVFLNWLADETRVDAHDISSRLGTHLEDLFNEIESELGNVLPENLDPRFVFLFLLK